MEMGFFGFVSFEQYKEKLKEKITQKVQDTKMTNEEIIKNDMEIVKTFERLEKLKEQKGG